MATGNPSVPGRPRLNRFRHNAPMKLIAREQRRGRLTRRSSPGSLLCRHYVRAQPRAISPTSVTFRSGSARSGPRRGQHLEGFWPASGWRARCSHQPGMRPLRTRAVNLARLLLLAPGAIVANASNMSGATSEASQCGKRPLSRHRMKRPTQISSRAGEAHPCERDNHWSPPSPGVTA